ncbi:MAG: FAD-binding domain-containing protein, partial [Candidatus Babeliales bacterium]
MKKLKYQKSIFIFRSDLRFEDNIGLIHALKNSNFVIPIYMTKNIDLFKIKNKNNQQFIIESLDILNKFLTKFNSKIFLINSIIDLKKIIKKDKNINAIFINKLYHPKQIEQEQKIQKICDNQKIEFKIFHDFLLHEINTIYPGKRKNIKSAYKVFSPFFRKSQFCKIQKPIKNNFKNYINQNYELKTNFNIKNLSTNFKINENINNHGGFDQANKILQNLKNFKNYQKIKDFPAIKGTTELSAYINTGCISIRNIYYKIIKILSKNHELIRQLYWREFYYNLYFAYPELFESTLKKPKIKWEYNKKIFNQWTSGKTNEPFVNASIKKLTLTGFINNRCRMLASNYLALRLKINWTWGEKYFAKKLIDYDPILNN